MTTVLLLAGGESSRMGTDKAQMHGGVQRLQNVAKSCGIKEIIVLCGEQERRSMFQGKVWSDPPFCNNLSEVIQWAFKKIDGAIQMICCDAFQLEVDGLQQLLLSEGAVPLDEQKIRQPLLANCPEGFELGESDGSVASLFSHLPSLDMGSKANQMKNFNLPSDDSFQ